MNGINVGALLLFNNNNIASWHRKWSITWRWVFCIRRHNNTKLGFYRMSTHQGDGVLCGLNIHLIDIRFQSQPNMKKGEWRGDAA